MKKNKFSICLCLLLFGVVGVYLTFFVGNIDKYDSQTKAYDMYVNESYDNDGGIVYHPIYVFEVDGNRYECNAKSGSSTYPKKNKNTVYYESSNPTNCKTEYEKSMGRFSGIVFLFATALIFYFFIIKKPLSDDELNQIQENDMMIDRNILDKTTNIIERGKLIFKKIIIIVAIIILIILTLIDFAVIKQTLKAKHYIETTAIYINNKSNENRSAFKEYIYSFIDKQGRTQEIIVSLPESNTPKDMIKIKYDGDNPQNYYEDDSLMDAKEIIFFVGKIFSIIILTIFLFNEKLLDKINISIKK